jgi:outer membrane protein assembly factor BamB
MEMAKAGWLLASACVLLGGSLAWGEDWPQWRGPDRTGISKEKGLMQAWPEGGPKKLWSVTTPGKGYGSPSVVGDTIYITGDEEGGKGFLYALDLAGKIKWAKPFGAEWTKSYPLSRTEPTIDDGMAYVFSSMGVAACLDAKTGELKWSVDTAGTFGGRNIEWGIAESPLVAGELFYCTPGGKDASVVALNKKTGQTVWASKGLSERSAYCSPLLTELGGIQQVLTQTEDHIVGLAAKSGEVLWKSPQRNQYAVHPNTPIVLDSMVFISSGYGYGSQLLKIGADGKSASQIWSEKQLDVHHEGVLMINGLLYGSRMPGRFICLDPKDGKVLYTVAGVKKASITLADGRIYAYDEKGGDVFLIEVSPTAGKVCGSFKVTEGSLAHWAHPVVANGVLYIRHGESLMAYDIKAK